MKRTKNRLMASVFALALVLGTQASAQNFDLEVRDSQGLRANEVCKVGQAFPSPVCYPSYASLFPEANFQSIELVKKIKAKEALPSPTKLELKDLEQIGGALLLRPADRQAVLKNFKVLSVRNIGVDVSRIRQTGTHNLIPFVASVRWIGYAGLNGTVHLEGEIALPINLSSIGGQNTNSTDFATSLEAVRYGFQQMLSVGHYNDSSTEMKKDWLRFLEASARQVHFRATKGLFANVDTETQRLIKEVVGPAVLTETIFIPMVKGMSSVVEKLGEAMGKAIGDALNPNQRKP